MISCYLIMVQHMCRLQHRHVALLPVSFGDLDGVLMRCGFAGMRNARDSLDVSHPALPSSNVTQQACKAWSAMHPNLPQAHNTSQCPTTPCMLLMCCPAGP